jgi:hypothetical protein
MSPVFQPLHARGFFLPVLLVLSGLLLLPACRASRSLEGTAPLTRTDADGLWAAVEDARSGWTRWEGKGRIEIEAPGEGRQGATAVLRMRRDTCIWISVRKAAIEGARIYIRPDSVFVLDRSNKTYTPLAYGELTEALGLAPEALSFARLQAAFAGEAILDRPLRWRSGLSEGRYLLVGDREGLEYRLELDPATSRLLREDIRELPSGSVVSGRRLVRDFVAWEGTIPTTRRWSLYGGSVPLTAPQAPEDGPVLPPAAASGEALVLLELDFNQIELDPEEMRTDFSVNPRYSFLPWEEAATAP